MVDTCGDSTTGSSAAVTVSVVSHGHDAWLVPLLDALARGGGAQVARVIVTHNLPPCGPPLKAASWPFDLLELRNLRPRSFAANHNTAFAHIATPFFCVINPDVHLPHDDGRAFWPLLCEPLWRNPAAGCAYARLLNPDGRAQDHLREVPTPWALIRRRVLQVPERRLDWTSAAFWLVRAEAFRALRGFDERYRLYCEDVDFCLRLRLEQWSIVASQATVIHEAQRASHRDARHLAWHVHSLLRLWSSGAYWRYLVKRETGKLG